MECSRPSSTRMPTAGDCAGEAPVPRGAVSPWTQQIEAAERWPQGTGLGLRGTCGAEGGRLQMGEHFRPRGPQHQTFRRNARCPSWKTPQTGGGHRGRLDSPGRILPSYPGSRPLKPQNKP